MTEPDDTFQRLISLKRYELPPTEFVDDFLVKFHQRQRADLMKQSLRELFMERMEGLFQRLSLPQLATASAAVVLVVVGGLTLLPKGTSDTGLASAAARPNHQLPVMVNADLPPPDILNKSANFGNNLPPEEAAKLSGLLLSKHFVGGYADEAREMVAGEFVNMHPQGFEAMPMFFGPDSDVTANTGKSDAAPVSASADLAPKN